MRQLLCQFFFAISFLLPAGQLTHAAEAARPPEVVVSEFYQWYMKELAADRNPLLNKNKSLSNYVAASLLQTIKRKMNSKDGMEIDYFIQAQDFPKAGFKASALTIKATNAIVTMTSRDRSFAHSFKVTFVKTAESWLISGIGDLKGK